MTTVTGLAVIVVGLICWTGQILVFLAPRIAESYGLCEPEGEMDPTFYVIETRSQCLVDILLSWILPLSALLMILDHGIWPVLALTGGGIYLYFAALIILNRLFLKRRGKRVGRASSVYAAYAFALVWILAAMTMIALAVSELVT